MDPIKIAIVMRNRVDKAQERNYWSVLVNAALNVRVPLAMKLVQFRYN
jgi:hypothetical protein